MPARRRKSRPFSRAELRRLFERYHETKDPTAREALILAHRGLASYLAAKFADRAEPHEDMTQVAQVGLINAVDRYDPSRGIEFSTFATPTIVGEIRRHFRDKLWSIHVPRRMRELNRTLMQSVDALSQRLGRSPTITELAEETGVPFDVVLEALEAGRAYTPASLDAERSEEEDSRAGGLADALGREDPDIERLEDRTTIDWALGRLSKREREIVMLRFSTQLSQSEIARRLGVSQMHVSRLQRSAIDRLRALIGGERHSAPSADPDGKPGHGYRDH
jgi:RNA polymerase sigma-B factor